MEQWFIKNHLSYQELTPCDLNRKFLLRMLQLSDKGFDSLLISKVRGHKTWEKFGQLKLEECSVNELIDIVLTSPQLLRTPIAFDEKHLSVGYNSEDLRIFLPSDFRKVGRQLIKEYQ